MGQRSAADRVEEWLDRVIAAGRPGDRVPTVRTIMAELEVGPGTVRRAVAELARLGRLETVPGSGTFIAASPRSSSAIGDHAWQASVLDGAAAGDDPLRVLHVPPPSDIVDLASGYPAGSLAAHRLLATAMRDVARRPGIFDRVPSDGIEPLRTWFADRIGAPDRRPVIVVPGGQAGLSLVLRALGRPGAPVFVESPTYSGALVAARAAGLVPVAVPIDGEGIDVEELGRRVRSHTGHLVYVQPRFQNPTGVTLSPERREALLRLAERERLVVVEDDWLADLDHRPIPPLAATDPHGHVVHLRSLTKVTAAGLRIAAIAAAGALGQRIRRVRGGEDFFVSGLLQELALAVVTSTGWHRHLVVLRTALADRRSHLLALLSEVEGIDGDACLGGPLHVWAPLSASLDDVDVRQRALRLGVAVVGGRDSFPADPSGPFLRVSAAASAESELAIGVERLAAALAEAGQR